MLECLYIAIGISEEIVSRVIEQRGKSEMEDLMQNNKWRDRTTACQKLN